MISVAVIGLCVAVAVEAEGDIQVTGAESPPAAESTVPVQSDGTSAEEATPAESDLPATPADDGAPAESDAAESDAAAGDVTQPKDAPADARPLDEGPPSARERALEMLRGKSDEDVLRPRPDGDLPLEHSWVGEKRPELFLPRRPGVAFLLGAVVGFGTGYYYAGESEAGLVFSLVDVALVAGFVATTVALNDLVIEHDFRSGNSLARGEREFGGLESRLYVGSIILALAEVGSHLFQGFGAMRAARRSNSILESFSFVPLGEGGSLHYQMRW